MKRQDLSSLVSRDNADREMDCRHSAERRARTPTTLLIGRRKSSPKMFDSNPNILRFSRASKKPIVIKARDGLELVSYLTTPPGVEAKHLPWCC